MRTSGEINQGSSHGDEDNEIASDGAYLSNEEVERMANCEFLFEDLDTLINREIQRDDSSPIKVLEKAPVAKRPLRFAPARRQSSGTEGNLGLDAAPVRKPTDAMLECPFAGYQKDEVMTSIYMSIEDDDVGSLGNLSSRKRDASRGSQGPRSSTTQKLLP